VSETVGRRLADGGLPEAELSERRLRTVLDEVPTVSGKRPLIRNLRRVDADLGDLNEVQTRRLSRLLARTDEDGVRLVNDLDNLEGDQIQTFLSTEEIDGFNSFSEWDQWRKSIATSYNRPEVEQSEVSNYIENIRQAGDSQNINNEVGLIEELVDSEGSLLGQSGEARSAVRYAEEGATVDVEPGDGEFDLRIQNDGTEYIEVKSRRGIPDFQWTDDKIGEINDKLERVANDPDIDATSENTIMEIQTTIESNRLEEARSEIISAVETRRIGGGDINFDQIRLELADGTSTTIDVGES